MLSWWPNQSAPSFPLTRLRTILWLCVCACCVRSMKSFSRYVTNIKGNKTGSYCFFCWCVWDLKPKSSRRKRVKQQVGQVAVKSPFQVSTQKGPLTGWRIRRHCTNASLSFNPMKSKRVVRYVHRANDGIVSNKITKRKKSKWKDVVPFRISKRGGFH